MSSDRALDPNPNLGHVPLLDGIVAVVNLFIHVPIAIASCLLRRMITTVSSSKNELPLTTDIGRSLVRRLSSVAPWSVIRKLAIPRNVEEIVNSKRFAHLKERLCEEVLRPQFAGYWVCKGPPGTPLQPAECDVVLLHIHGGAYILGHPLMALARLLRVSEIAAAAGAQGGLSMSIFSLRYSLAPESIFPKQQEQAVAAFTYLLEEMHVNASQIIVSGESAGGHLAVAMLLGLAERQLPKPGGAFLACPWVDLTNSGASFLSNKYNDTLIKDGLDRALQAALGPEGVTGQSAHLLNFAGTPPPNALTWERILPSFTWVTVGTYDVFVDDISTFVKNARADGAEVELEMVPAKPHAWQGFSDRSTTSKYLQMAPSEEVADDMMAGSKNIANGLLTVVQRMQNNGGRDVTGLRKRRT